MPKPIDDVTRKLVVSEQDRNIVVTAGAGTGKTTLLVNRMLHLLLGHKRFQNEESPIRKVVAMTFTEKAASDMKIRLLSELEKIAAVISGNASEDEKQKVEGFLAHIRDTYQVTYSEIERRVRKSLEDMDKAIIGTIHSFAAYILRLYPIESGVVPGFVVDEGDIFDELFDKEWTKWLDTELALASLHARIWKEVLKRLDLGSLKGLAKRLSGFTVPFNSLASESNDKSNIRSTAQPGGNYFNTLQSPFNKGGEKGGNTDGVKKHAKTYPQVNEKEVPLPCNSILDLFLNKICEIIPYCEKPDNNLLLQLQELSRIFNEIKKQGIRYLNSLEYDIDKEASKAKTGWTEDGFETAQEYIKEGHNLLKKLKAVDEEFVKTVLALVLPFAKAFRQTYLSQGYVSFDGLLTLTRDLLQNSEYRYIRNKLKFEFRTILVDEFQDTDPVQYEIVLFLSEAPGHYSKEARKVTLEPGKLFIVGDPKQSIYAFRRADIEAYEEVVKQVCGQDEVLKLQENFRSHSGIVDVINQLFDGRIMMEHSGLQPCYIPIHANRPKTHPSQKVEIVLVSDKEGKEIKADEAREAEAEWIARWITKKVDNELLEDRLAENGLRKLKYKDIAFLLRAFTQVRPYVEAFKRYGVPYIVEGEKYFYTTQEILDFMNLLRVIENPHDTIALVGVLRSPIVGLTDREIYELQVNHLLDYRKDVLNGLDFKTIIEGFYLFLRKFHARAGILPVSQLITEIMEETHVAEITASAWHGEQKLANLWKLYQTACDMEQLEGISFKTFVDRIAMRIKEAREEGESPLSDETLDVVKILTIHKSKGLEFPVVILGNLHGGVRNDNEMLDSAVFDWSTSTTGIVIGKDNQQVRNLQSIVIEKKLNDRSWEEEKRVLYVAMTRAKERLILTGLLKNDDKSYMGLITKSVRDATGIELGDETFVHLCHAKEDEILSSSPNPSYQGRGNVGDFPSGEGNKTYEENKTDEEKSLLPLRERVRAGGILKGKFSLGNAEVFVEYFRFDGTHRPQKTPKEKTWDVDWTAFVEIWKKRETAMIEATQMPLFVSPSTIADEETITHRMPSVPSKVERSPDVHPNHAALIGSICHHVLEEWDFQETFQELQRSIESAVKWAVNLERVKRETSAQFQREDLTYQRENLLMSLSSQGKEKECSNTISTSSKGLLSPPYEGGEKGEVIKHQEIPFDTIQIQDVEFIKAELLKILSDFIGSEAYKELQGVQILGREMPILLNWNGQIMRGIIDILYKIGDRITIADYKTDHVTMTDLPAKAEKYRYQKKVYVDAVKRCLKIDNPEFKLIFLRLGKAVSI